MKLRGSAFAGDAEFCGSAERAKAAKWGGSRPVLVPMSAKVADVLASLHGGGDLGGTRGHSCSVQ